MATILNFQTDRGKFAIELIENNDFVKFWLAHFSKLIKDYKLKAGPVNWPHCKVGHHSTTDALIDKIFNCIDEINSADYLCPLPEKFNKDQFYSLGNNTQQVLNRLHRYCVVATEFRNRWKKNDSPQFEFVGWKVDHFTHIINLLNQTIHALEAFVITEHKKKFRNKINFIEINFISSKFSDVTVYADGVDLKIPDILQDNLRLTGYDVWIKKDILGKDFITAFADHDDPREFDIRPPPMVSGGLQIDKNSTKRNELLHSREFIDWLGKTPTDYYGNYPLGNVIIGKEIISSIRNIESVTIES